MSEPPFDTMTHELMLTVSPSTCRYSLLPYSSQNVLFSGRSSGHRVSQSHLSSVWLSGGDWRGRHTALWPQLLMSRNRRITRSVSSCRGTKFESGPANHVSGS